MSLVALDGTPLVAIGMAARQSVPFLSVLGNTTVDAAKEASITIGQIFTEDGLSHTIDTTGSSSFGWRTSTVTFANVGTTVKVGLATVDTANGPAGRAVNVTDVITFDVSKSLTGGGGGIIANAWQTHVPDAGTKTIANGDLVAFCVQATAIGGVDSVLVSDGVGSVTGIVSLPTVNNFTGGAYAATTRLPNVVITFSDGKLGFFYGGYVASVGSTSQTWNNASSPNEYGNFMQLPVPVKAYGITLGGNFLGDADVVLYSDPLGTPVAQKTVSVDLNTIGTASSGAWGALLFPAPFTINANTPVATILKPTSATNVTMNYKTFNASAHQKSETLGINGYAINRASGAFAAQNSSNDRFAIGLLVGAFDAGGTSGPAAQRLLVQRGTPY